MDDDGPQRVTVEEAAHFLKVSTKTIQRHIAAGRLTKVKMQHRTFVLRNEVEDLATRRKHGQEAGQPPARPRTDFQDTVTLTRERYDRLLIELGELRKERDYLLAARSAQRELELLVESKENQLTELRKLLADARAASANPTSPATVSAFPAGEASEKNDGEPRKPWWHR